MAPTRRSPSLAAACASSAPPAGRRLQRKFTFDRKTGAGIELYRNTARYITVSGLEIGECAALPPIDGLIDTLLARHGGGPARRMMAARF